jgi:hypothetical protein
MVMMTQINATPIKPPNETNFLNESSFFHSSHKTFSQLQNNSILQENFHSLPNPYLISPRKKQ